MKFLTSLLLLMASSCLCFAQKETDSLLNLLPYLKGDTSRVKVLADLAFSYWSHNPEMGKKYAEEALLLAENLGYEKGKSKALNSMGVLKWSLGDFAEAIRYYQQSLVISEKLRDEKSAARIYNNMAMIYSRLKNYEDALLFYSKSLAVDEKTKDTIGIAMSLNNIGLTYLEKKEYDKSLRSLMKALSIYRKLDAKDKIGQTLSNIGLNYAEQKSYATALQYYKESEALYLENGLKRGLSILYTNIGNTYLSLSDYTLSGKYFQDGLKLAKELGSKERISESFLSLSQLDSATGNYKNAYENYLKHTKLQTEIFEQNHAKELNNFKIQYEVKEKETENKLLRSQSTLQQAYLKQQGYVLAGTIALFILAAGIAFLYYRYYKNKTKANNELKQLNDEIIFQREELKVANEEIRSINENLENIVRQRSNHIEFQNHQLTEYAFFNAHKVRGPLARILGIINLIKINPEWLQSDNLVEKLEEAAQELDESIKEINVILDGEEPNQEVT